MRCRQTAAFDVFEREVGQTVLFANLVNADHIRMLEVRYRFRFDLKAGKLVAARVSPASTILSATTRFRPFCLAL